MRDALNVERQSQRLPTAGHTTLSSLTVGVGVADAVGEEALWTAEVTTASIRQRDTRSLTTADNVTGIARRNMDTRVHIQQEVGIALHILRYRLRNSDVRIPYDGCQLVTAAEQVVTHCAELLGRLEGQQRHVGEGLVRQLATLIDGIRQIQVAQ